MNYFNGALKQSDIFFECTEDQLEAISKLCSSQIYQSGDFVFEENSRSDDLYIIAQGEINILVNPGLVSDQQDPDRKPVTIATLRRGQSFGEIALVDRGLRSAAVQISQDNTQLLRFSRDDLLALCEADPRLGYCLMRNLAVDLALKIRTADLRIRQALL
jgi:CRP/FNR family transcriptional regulator, cyclic AMP receptor protein